LPAHLASLDERIAHRTWIGGAIRTLLMMYSDFPNDPRVAAEMGRMWAEDLEWFPQGIIEVAIATYRRSETRKPTPAAIIKLCREHMPKPRLISAPEPERERATAEQARAILEEFGFGGIVKRMPRSGDE
jgi:hypothetical protein